MTRPGLAVWLGRGLALLGLALVVEAVREGSVWGLVGALGGVLAAAGLALAPLERAWAAHAPAAPPSNFEHTLDLLRRAYGARAAWAVGLESGDAEVVATDAPGPAERARGAALVQFASVDGRAHVASEPEGTYIAVGDFPFGAGVLLGPPDGAPNRAALVTDELRRLLAGMRLAQLHEETARPSQRVSKQLAAIVGGAQTLDGIAKAGVTLAQHYAQRGAAIVLQGTGPAVGAPRVVAVSPAADGRLVGLTLDPDAPAARALTAGVPVVTRTGEDVFGSALADRRRQDRAGIAYPMLDGHFVIGALVVMGPPVAPGSPASHQLERLVIELGSRLAAARALHEAEQRAVRDPLTGLCNRRELERALAHHSGAIEKADAGVGAGAPGGGEDAGFATLLYADLDHFKALNDTLGHAAGDAALRHVARILETQVRDTDLVARIGGEEFAVWMPHTPLGSGLEVAERIRTTLASQVWLWSGAPYPLTVSCGVASYPDVVRDVANLRAAADAALYRAKQLGRNRVEKAEARG